MIKPRITIAGPMQYKRERLCGSKTYITMPFWFWKCEGDGIVEYGSSVKLAYSFWLMEIRRRSTIEKAKSLVKQCWNRISA